MPRPHVIPNRRSLGDCAWPACARPVQDIPDTWVRVMELDGSDGPIFHTHCYSTWFHAETRKLKSRRARA